MIKFPRIIKWVLYLFVMLVLLMSLLRVVFFYYFNPQHLSLLSNTDALWMGLRFDARIAAIILLPLLILGSIEFKKKFSEFSLVRKTYTFLICFIPISALLLIGANFNDLLKVGSKILTGFGISFMLMLILQMRVLNPFASTTAKKIWFWYLGIALTVWTLFYGFDFAHYSY
ncbi:MAG: hypothetical protein ACM3H8_16345, partial [Sphingobacteriales bacterium]